jgi:hypothetical protein
LEARQRPQWQGEFTENQLNQANSSSICTKNHHLEQIGVQAAFHGLVAQSVLSQTNESSSLAVQLSQSFGNVCSPLYPAAWLQAKPGLSISIVL